MPPRVIGIWIAMIEYTVKELKIAMSISTIESDDVLLEITKSVDLKSIQELQKAFMAFSQMSQQLSESYALLEQKVSELSGKLISLSEQRLQELQEKEQLADQLSKLLSLLPAAVIVLDHQGIIRRVNPIAQQWLSLALNNDQNFVNASWNDVIGNAFAPKQSDYHELSLADGRLVSLSTCPLDHEGQLIMMTDQTKTRELQDQVARQQRLTAMGQMMASLAHQIRTPLSAAMLYASNLSLDPLPRAKHQLFSHKLMGRLKHLEKQVQDMLLFVKGEVPLVHRCCVIELIDALKDAISAINLSEKGHVGWIISAHDSMVLCQKDVLINAFMNIVNNAIEACLPEKVNITIRVYTSDERLCIDFEDNGPGMSDQHIQLAQSPFFTTKSHGTGLGLAVVKIVMHAHHGTLLIERGSPVGTKISVTMPIDHTR